MRFVFLLMMSGWLFGCSPKQGGKTAHEVAKAGLIKDTVVTVTIQAQDEGLWRADYIFAEPQTAVIFSRSRNDYRSKSWKSLDQNVHFERIDGIDAVLFNTPAQVMSFEFVPFTGNLRRDYTPFTPFSDGGLAVYTGQFEVLSVQNREAIEKLDGSLQNWQGEQGKIAVRVLSSATMIKDGNITKNEAVDISLGGGSYIYIGKAKITQGKDFIGVIDPGLPSWIVNRFDDDLGKIFDGLRELWGTGLTEKSMILFSFRGYEGQGFSSKGGALGNMLALETSGPAMKNESKRTLQRLHWFFAHEAAHLFQTRDAVQMDDLHNAWLTEGGANAMANNVLRLRGLADEAYILGEYAREFSQCVEFLQTSKLTDAVQKGKYNIPYACGDIFAQISDAALKDDTLFNLWNTMLADAKEAGKYSVEDYFAAMEKLGASEKIISGLQKLTIEKVDNPGDILKGLMAESGLAPKFNADGQLTDLTLP